MIELLTMIALWCGGTQGPTYPAGFAEPYQQRRDFAAVNRCREEFFLCLNGEIGLDGKLRGNPKVILDCARRIKL